jgi:hypothetical protein
MHASIHRQTGEGVSKGSNSQKLRQRGRRRSVAKSASVVHLDRSAFVGSSPLHVKEDLVAKIAARTR